MKKILLIIPFVFCLVLSSLSIIPVHAANYLDTPAESYEGASCMVHPLDNLLEVSGNPKYYFWYNTYRIKDDDKYQIETKFIYYDDEISVEEDNGVYTINFLGSSGYNLISVEHDSLPNYDFNSGSSATDVLKTIIFDSNTNDLSRVRENGDIVSYITDGFTFNCFLTNMFLPEKRDEIEVTVDPELHGIVSLNFDNLSYDYIDVTIKSNSDSAYQYSIFVVKEGDSISFDNLVDGEITSDSNITLTGKSYSGNAQFAYITDEWVQTYINNDVAVVNAPSTWHYLYPKGQQIAHISVYGIKLLPNVQYRFLVYACKIPDSKYPISYVGDPAFDVDYRPYEAYGIDFRVSSATPFNPDLLEDGKSLGGVYAFDPDVDTDNFFDKVNGYEDSKGNVIVSGKKFNELHSIGGSSSGSGGVGTYNTVVTNSRSFFSFTKTVLGYFPPVLITVFQLGLWSILLLAIIRRLH